MAVSLNKLISERKADILILANILLLATRNTAISPDYLHIPIIIANYSVTVYRVRLYAINHVNYNWKI